MDIERIYAGWVSKAQIANTADTLVINFPIQSDQGAREWIVDNDADNVDPFAATVRDNEGGLNRQGGYAGRIAFRTPTKGMVNYLINRYFPSGVHKARLTILVATRLNSDTVALNVIANLAPSFRDLELVGRAYDPFPLDWLNGTVAPEGADASITASFAGALVAGVTTAFNITVSNVATTTSTRASVATWTDLVVTLPITPAELAFVSLAASGWTAEWSTNGGTSYTNYTSPPPTPALVNYLRFTYTPSVLSGASAPGIAVNLRPPTVGAVSLTATVTMTGDINLSNNTITVTANALAGSGFDSGFDSGFGSPTTGFSSGFDLGFGYTPTGFDSGFDQGFSS